MSRSYKAGDLQGVKNANISSKQRYEYQLLCLHMFHNALARIMEYINRAIAIHNALSLNDVVYFLNKYTYLHVSFTGIKYHRVLNVKKKWNYFFSRPATVR